MALQVRMTLSPWMKLSLRSGCTVRSTDTSETGERGPHFKQERGGHISNKREGGTLQTGERGATLQTRERGAHFIQERGGHTSNKREGGTFHTRERGAHFKQERGAHTSNRKEGATLQTRYLSWSQLTLESVEEVLVCNHLNGSVSDD